MTTSPTTAFLDVFILTFNAGKQQIDPSVFARHLRNAFAQNATGLPELVVFCLQEMAPLAQSFIGSYMINPCTYSFTSEIIAAAARVVLENFQCYASAVNLAARNDVAWSGRAQERDRGVVGCSDADEDAYQNQEEPGGSPYTLVTSRNVGLTGIMLFALNPEALHHLKSTEVGFGAGDMGNKGALGLRMLFSKEDAGGRTRQTELTFVGTHLAAHEWNLEKRNKHWENIVSGLLFEDPKKLRGPKSASPTPRTSSDGDERDLLLAQDPNEKALHDITIYKPGSHLFVAGDLNYRISRTPPSPESAFPDLDPKSPNYFKRFLALDQLALEKSTGRTLHGLSESTILFPPTYKLEITDAEDVASWKWAPHRWPGWCDRILYLDIPPWAPTTSAKIDTLAYDALPPVRTSDHRAVYLRARVPVLEASILAPSNSTQPPDSTDPRIKLPYPVDFESWDHRARVKKWESVMGWCMLVSQSKQGIAIFVILSLVGLGTWWLRSR
ncbi:Endonuclease/exonuclease/phosphatase [Nemania abortiva]|nr:Endonuclease/exonuclease/phosphatase [Nemania abortiva]